MTTYSVVEYPYFGSVLSVNLFSDSATILLSAFGTAQTTVLVDDGTQLYVGEVLTMGGQQYEFLGSVTAQPGINLLGLTVPTGLPKDLLLLRDVTTGALHFVFPDGVPNALGMIAMVVSLDEIGYDLATKGPLCLAEGSLVETDIGPVPVEELVRGSRLVCPRGQPLTVLTTVTEARPEGGIAAHLPVVIRADAFGPGCPARDLKITQQHRIGVKGPLVELMFGLEAALVPALGLVDFQKIVIGYSERPKYCHLICDRHDLCLVEGLTVETLLWGDRAFEMLGPDLAAELRSEFSVLQRSHQQCLPSLTMAETRLLTRAGRKAEGQDISPFLSV